MIDWLVTRNVQGGGHFPQWRVPQIEAKEKFFATQRILTWRKYILVLLTPVKLKYKKETGYVENVRISNKFLKNTSLAIEGR